jgi:pyruvate/2-oxoglutarate dehydrogenase complex dihydrolipoamide acyltransferase (E2) component
MTVADAAEGATVSTSADVDLTGRAAQMGHGVVAAVSAQLLKQMSANLEASIAADGASAPTTTLATAAPASATPTAKLAAAPKSAAATPQPAAAPREAAPPQPSAPRPAAPPTPSTNNDLRAGKLMLAVLRSWVARLTRRDRKGTTR